MFECFVCGARYKKKLSSILCVCCEMIRLRRGIEYFKEFMDYDRRAENKLPKMD